MPKPGRRTHDIPPPQLATQEANQTTPSAPATKEGAWRGLQVGSSLAERLVIGSEAHGEEFWQMVENSMAAWVNIPHRIVIILIITPITNTVTPSYLVFTMY